MAGNVRRRVVGGPGDRAGLRRRGGRRDFKGLGDAGGSTGPPTHHPNRVSARAPSLRVTLRTCRVLGDGYQSASHRGPGERGIY
ncbi:hypothetical protein NDU88_001701 [Pleurodeles waltl]|uniref:Uncharacterized protein n=1 Tax=Pleurodeles waltl TaxID=8319 RepID=A0AAV7Q7X0_PLEWA|nr:hypothetical protein NDU88_001701 [Pleurodeles waltl]